MKCSLEKIAHSLAFKVANTSILHRKQFETWRRYLSNPAVVREFQCGNGD